MTTKEQEDAVNLRTGIVSALGAYILWGVLPVYWKWLLPVPKPCFAVALAQSPARNDFLR